MNKELINSIIKDTTDVSSISDGEFTFGELQSDRLTLLISYLNLLSKISKLKKSDDYLWVSEKDYEGNKITGFVHVGYRSTNTKAIIGAKVPKVVTNIMLSMDARELDVAPKYDRLNKSLKFYINE